MFDLKIRITLAIVISLLPILIFSQKDDSLKIAFNANYTTDIGRNFKGGLKAGNFYMGLLNLSLEVNLFKNGHLYFQVQNTHGSLATNDFVGDMQTFSNIENGNYTYLYAAWYKHTFGKFSATLGVHDLNSEFNVTDLGGYYTNSSFGIQPSLSWNMPVSIFPKNALGLNLKYDFSEKFSLLMAIYDGDPGNLIDDKYNLDHRIDIKNQGLLGIAEIQMINNRDQNNTKSFKLGFVYHSIKYCEQIDSSFSIGNYGIYFLSDWSMSKHSGVFLQFGWSPQKRNLNSIYAGAGINFIDLGKSKRHTFGLAVAYANISKDFCKYYPQTNEPFETAIEFFYKAKITENISIQPDIQFILNPGIFNYASNALVSFVRMSIEI